MIGPLHESADAGAPGDPRQLGVDEFSAYALVIDARTPHEYDEDHIPGAVNLPVVNDAEFADVGIAHAKNPHTAYVVGAAYASMNIAAHIRDTISRCDASDRLLVYCFRGGKRSRVWADTLRNIGFETDVVKGGWKAYRRWVIGSLEALPTRFQYRVLAGLTGCGKTRLLHALERQGHQVLDLEGIASHRGSLLGLPPGQRQPTQKTFDSLLLDRLRRFDPDRPVWLEAESKKIGNVQLPEALFDAMQRSQPLIVSAPMRERVRLLIEDYPHFATDPAKMVELLQPLKPLVGNEELGLWHTLARDGMVEVLFERVLVSHYDPCYLRSQRRSPFAGEPLAQIELPALDPARLGAAADDLAGRFGFLERQSESAEP